MQTVRLTSGIDYGNLTGLIGTWTGVANQGYNLIAVPDQAGEFTLLVAPYSETLVVNALPATTPNRGLQTIANIPTLQYSTTIIDDEDNILMHAENGFWELNSEISQNNGFDIFRLASVPHGGAVQAMGNSTVIQGPPVIDTTLSAMPLGDLPALNGITSQGYTDPYIGPPKYSNFFPTSPNMTLVKYLEAQEQAGTKVTQTVELKVSTQNNGGISNIASLTTNANATQFDATFWIETLEDSNGNVSMQLQYSQRIMIAFPIKTSYSGQTILWPHINVNTLTLAPAVA